MEQVGVGVIGAGLLGERHARVFSELPNSRMAAVADVDSARAERVATTHGVAAYSDFREMLERLDIQAVAVATPDHLHAAPVLAALAAGKHVLVEKPLATTISDARRMVAAVEDAEVILQVNYSQRFVPEYAWTKSRIDAGEIGRPLVVRSLKSDTITVPTEMIGWAAETSPIFFMTSHDLDLVRWYISSEIEEVFAYEVMDVLVGRGFDVHDAVETLVRFESGAVATFGSAWIYPNGYPTVADAYLEIVGSEGVISLGRGMENTIYDADKGRLVKLATAYEVDGTLYGAFRHSLDHFVGCVISGNEPMISASRTLGVTLAQCAIRESIARQRPVKPRDL